MTQPRIDARSLRARLPYIALLAGLAVCALGSPASAQDATATPPVMTEPAPTDTAPPADATAAPAAPAPAPATPPPAPPPPPPLVNPGGADVGAFGEKVSYDKPKTDITSLNASAGGSFNSGNTKAYLLNAGADFRLIRAPHGVGAQVAFAYGRAKPPDAPGNDLLETVKNLNAKARYDFFFTENDGAFLATAFRWDPFAGINRRNQFQIGYLRYFFVEEKHRFWGELGYDLTVDYLGTLPMKEPPDDPHQTLHSARLFIGYENQLNEAVTYLGGVEALLNFQDPKYVRVNWDNALRSSIAGALKIELKFRLAWDRGAVERRAEQVDTATIVSLLYTLL